MPDASPAAEARLSPDDPLWQQALNEVLAKVRTGGGVHLVAQPIVGVENAAVVGYELLAWFESELDRPPDEWFAAATRLGVAVPLTVAVLERMHGLRRLLPPNTFCTVNVQPRLLTDQRVRQAMLITGDLSRVVVELTENLPADDPQIVAAIEEIREAGGTVAMDDGGTGYAGLSQLLAFRPDIVKIDQGLVADVHSDPVRRALVQMLGEIAGRMDAWLVAEGVEDLDDLDALAHLGVPLAQGWALGRPAAPFQQAALEAGPSLRPSTVPSQAGSAVNGHVAAIMRRCRTRTANQASDAQLGDVVVDQAGRPIAVVVRDLGERLVRVAAMTVAPSTPPHEVLRRAMSRPSHHRAVPLVCTDSRGAAVGLVAVSDLVDAVGGSGRVPYPLTRQGPGQYTGRRGRAIEPALNGSVNPSLPAIGAPRRTGSAGAR